MRHFIDTGLSLLPPFMDSPAARIMLFAIGLQESQFLYRQQKGGPARGFWQFEVGGIIGVLNHNSSGAHIRKVLADLRYDDSPQTSYRAIEHNDALACAYARLLLWTLPWSLPDNAEDGWKHYISAWRPGKPRRETWDEYFKYAQGIA